MKIFFLTEGGRKIGFGHITRCLSLCQAVEQRGASSEFIINGDNSVLGILEAKNYQIFDWVKQREKLFKALSGADAIIIDSYLAPGHFYKKIGHVFPGKLIIIDDFNKFAYHKGFVINPSLYGKGLKRPRNNKVIYLSGRNYIILRKEFWNVPGKKIHKELKNILITFGGTNCGNLAIKTKNYLKDKFGFNCSVLDAKNKSRAKEVLKRMLKSDLCISGGGQTMFELARVGVPTIGVSVARNQNFNLESWRKNGCIEYAGPSDGKNVVKRIEASVKKLIPYNERLKRSRIGKKFVDGKGAERIISKLFG